MSNGTFDLRSAKLTELYQLITEQQPAQEHWTLDGGGFAAVIKKRGKTSILIYHFARSIKPLARIVEGGVFAVMRDYYTEEQLLEQLGKLHAVVTAANVTSGFSGGVHTHGGTSFKVGPDDYLHPAAGSEVSEEFQSRHSLRVAHDVGKALNQYFPDTTKPAKEVSEVVSDNLSDLLDKTHKIATDLGIPLPPRNRKVCDPHRQ